MISLCWHLQRMLLAIVTALMLSGCGSKSVPPTFDLSTLETGRISGGLRGQIEVVEPTASQVFDSEQVIVRDNGRLSFLGGGQWADRLPLLLQSRMVQSLENTLKFGSVARSGSTISADRQLVTDIRSFEINAETREAVIILSSKIVDSRNGKVIKARLFESRQPVAELNVAAATYSLDQALLSLLVQLALWI